MKDFNFQEWECSIEVNKLSHLRFSDSEYSEAKRKNVDNGLIDLIILKEDENCLKPKEEQVNCINWIVNNQDKILNLLYSALREIIYPYYANLWNEDVRNEGTFPGLNSVKDLERVLGMNVIEILVDHKENISYCRFYFNFCVDREHGLVITLHRDRLIDFCANGDVNHRKIIEDLGLNYSEWLSTMMKKDNT